MSFLDKEFVKKIKPQIISAVKNLFNDEAQNNAFSTKNQKKSSNKTDIFLKKQVEDTIVTPVSKKVWVNGKEYNIIANSQQELDEKIKTINKKYHNETESKVVETTEVYFNPSSIKKINNLESKNILNGNNFWYQNYNIA
jgi:hypothetical protein